MVINVICGDLIDFYRISKLIFDIVTSGWSLTISSWWRFDEVDEFDELDIYILKNFTRDLRACEILSILNASMTVCPSKSNSMKWCCHKTAVSWFLQTVGGGNIHLYHELFC